jgi:hypothetical protein
LVTWSARNAIECPGGPRADRTRRATDAVDDLPVHETQCRGESAAQLEQDERDVACITAAARRLLVHRQDGRAYLVRRAHVHSVHLAMRRYGTKMHHARRHDGRQCRAPQRAHQRPHAPDAPRLAVGGEACQPEIVLREVPRSGEWQAIARRAGDEIERHGLVEQVDEHCRVRERVGGGERSLEEELSVVQAAQVDAHRAGIDADHARHDG